MCALWFTECTHAGSSSVLRFCAHLQHRGQKPSCSQYKVPLNWHDTLPGKTLTHTHWSSWCWEKYSTNLNICEQECICRIMIDKNIELKGVVIILRKFRNNQMILAVFFFNAACTFQILFELQCGLEVNNYRWAICHRVLVIENKVICCHLVFANTHCDWCYVTHA